MKKKMMNKQKQFIIHHEVKAFEKKSFWKKDKTFFKAWWVIIGLEKQKGNEERKNKNKFNSMKSCVLFYDSEICQKTPEIFVGNILFIFFLNFKANFVIMVSELWCTLEQVLCTQWAQSLFKVASLFSYITKVCNRTVKQKEAFSLHINI